MLRFNFWILLFLCSFSRLYAEGGEKGDAGSFIVVVDAGHGGRDGGARGHSNSEKHIALKVSLKLRDALRAKGIKVVMTRSTDVFIPLYERIAIANRAKASLFISIHCNSLPYKSAGRASVKGTETYVSGFGRLDEQDIAIRENASILLEKNYKKNYNGYDPKDPESIILLSLMKNAYRSRSIQLAQLVQKEYRRTGRVDKGVHEKSLAVLARASMPAILTEIGYLSSPVEERYLASASGQQAIVDDIVKAVLAFR